MTSKNKLVDSIDNELSVALRMSAMVYSVASYFIGVVALVYLILFIADLLVPISINKGAGIALELTGATAALWNLAVVAIWGLQHTVMARPAFKRVWTKIVPNPIERSTYLIFVAMATAVLILFWIPMPTVLWDTTGTVFYSFLLGVYFLGWIIVLFATFLINHFHLFGLQQAFLFMRKYQSKQETFRTPLLYKLVRHPMMSGVLIALWAVPVLTTGRLLFNVLMTIYIYIGMYFEERTLSAELGPEYEQYLQTTPSVMPNMSRKPSTSRESVR